MATIQKRQKRDGSTSYTATVRKKQHGRIVHQESRTFSRESAAKGWGRRREVELEDPATLARAISGETAIGDLIGWYVEEFGEGAGRSKLAALKALQRTPLAERDALELTTAQLIAHVRERRAQGAGPATVGNDLTFLGTALRAAMTVRGDAVSPSVVNDARAACRELRLIARPRKRSRRPTAAELEQLDAYFGRRDGRAQIPMRDVMWFAIYSARREAEICRLLWADCNKEDRTGVVRDAKHPRHKLGNHRTFAMTGEAWEVLARQPEVKGEPRVFPYNSKSVGAAFTRACHVLGIEDLHFHDLRHEATSRLFERGYQIHEVAQFTLHESWNELKRYTNLRPADVRKL